MAFTDRFISVPIMMINSEHDNIMGNNPGEGEIVGCILELNPRRIESICETIPSKDFRSDNKIWTSVVMESGESFIVRLTLAKFKKILNDHLTL